MRGDRQGVGKVASARIGCSPRCEPLIFRFLLWLPFEPTVLLIQQVVNFADQFMELGGILLVRRLLAEFHPSLFGFAFQVASSHRDSGRDGSFRAAIVTLRVSGLDGIHQGSRQIYLLQNFVYAESCGQLHRFLANKCADHYKS